MKKRNLNELFDLLPDTFTARKAMEVWGYKRRNNAYFQLRALEEADMIEVMKMETKVDKGSCGQRGQYITWRKTL